MLVTKDGDLGWVKCFPYFMDHFVLFTLVRVITILLPSVSVTCLKSSRFHLSPNQMAVTSVSHVSDNAPSFLIQLFVGWIWWEDVVDVKEREREQSTDMILKGLLSLLLLLTLTLISMLYLWIDSVLFYEKEYHMMSAQIWFAGLSWALLIWYLEADEALNPFRHVLMKVLYFSAVITIFY